MAISSPMQHRPNPRVYAVRRAQSCSNGYLDLARVCASQLDVVIVIEGVFPGGEVVSAFRAASATPPLPLPPNPYA